MNEWSYISIPFQVSIVRCLSKHRELQKRKDAISYVLPVQDRGADWHEQWCSAHALHAKDVSNSWRYTAGNLSEKMHCCELADKARFYSNLNGPRDCIEALKLYNEPSVPLFWTCWLHACQGACCLSFYSKLLSVYFGALRRLKEWRGL